jgi:hypothetical protein
MPSRRPLLVAGLIIIPLLWFGMPALAARNWLSAGNLAENSVNALHGNKVTGVLGRLIDLYEWPMALAVLAGLIFALWRRAGTILVLAGAALLWVAIEIAFALHGWSAVPRYLFEPAAVLIVIAATGVGRLLAAGPRSRGAVRWLGPAIAAAVVLALIPAARTRARFIHGEISYGRKFARQVDRLHDLVAREGGRARILGCGQPVSALQFQSALAWEVGLNVGNVGWQPPRAIASGNPIVLVQPRGWGWDVRPIHPPSPQCARLRTVTALSEDTTHDSRDPA